MTMMTLTQNEGPISSGFRVDVSRGERVGRVSSEWFCRPDVISVRSISATERGRFAHRPCLATNVIARRSRREATA